MVVTLGVNSGLARNFGGIEEDEGLSPEAQVDGEEIDEEVPMREASPTPEAFERERQWTELSRLREHFRGGFDSWRRDIDAELQGELIREIRAKINYLGQFAHMCPLAGEDRSYYAGGCADVGALLVRLASGIEKWTQDVVGLKDTMIGDLNYMWGEINGSDEVIYGEHVTIIDHGCGALGQHLLGIRDTIFEPFNDKLRDLLWRMHAPSNEDMQRARASGM